MRDRKEYYRKWRAKNVEKCRAAVNRFAAKPENRAKKRLYDSSPERKAAKRATTNAWKKTAKGRLVNKRAKMKQLYGLTPEAYARMVEAQHGVCGLCGRPNANNRPLYIDHDHVTGKNRMLLCNSCNIALGLFQESPALLREAAEYIERYR